MCDICCICFFTYKPFMCMIPCQNYFPNKGTLFFFSCNNRIINFLPCSSYMMCMSTDNNIDIIKSSRNLLDFTKTKKRFKYDNISCLLDLFYIFFQRLIRRLYMPIKQMVKCIKWYCKSNHTYINAVYRLDLYSRL